MEKLDLNVSLDEIKGKVIKDARWHDEGIVISFLSGEYVYIKGVPPLYPEDGGYSVDSGELCERELHDLGIMTEEESSEWKRNEARKEKEREIDKKRVNERGRRKLNKLRKDAQARREGG